MTEVIALLDNVTYQPSVDTGVHLVPGDTQTDRLVVTPARGEVVELLRGELSDTSTLGLVFPGGRANGFTIEMSDQISPPATKVLAADRLLVAGPMVATPRVGRALEPWFVYAVDGAGRATSLPSSAGDTRYPSFPLSEVRKGLAQTR